MLRPVWEMLKPNSGCTTSPLSTWGSCWRKNISWMKLTTCPAGWPTGSCPTAAPTLAARAEETIVAARASHFSLAASVSFGLDRFGITGFWWYLPILALAAHVLSSPRFATDWCYSIVHFDIRLPKYGFVKIISMHLSLLFNDISIKQCLFLHLWGRRKLYKSNQKISWKDFYTLPQQNLRLVWHICPQAEFLASRLNFLTIFMSGPLAKFCVKYCFQEPYTLMVTDHYWSFMMN